jgi:hypothetical protein
MRVVCVKRLNVEGGTVNNLTIGKQYDITILPIPIPEDDEMDENPKIKKCIVWSDDINSEYVYPLDSFVSLEDWRNQRIDNLL